MQIKKVVCDIKFLIIDIVLQIYPLK